MSRAPEKLTLDETRKVARLSRMALSEEQLAEQSERLGAVLDYIERLRKLDLENVEPLANPAEETNRLRSDEPEEGYPTDVLMSLAPAKSPPFVTTPKPGAGSGGGA
jgi:aspartyl-tRNA(Asn)/glutamyl-tRNA(Gln) amidotransferase subunit C